MDKEQALYAFWSSFGLPAYDEYTVPDDATLPYITYQTATDSLGQAVPLSASVWYKGTRWDEVSDKADEIAERIGSHGHVVMRLDNGFLWITQGRPFAQRIQPTENSDLIKRIYMNIMVEFLTAY